MTYSLFFFFECYGDHLDLHVLTHSFPTRRSSDLTLLPLGAPGLVPPCILHRRFPFTAGDWHSVPERVRARQRGDCASRAGCIGLRSEEHTSELQSLMRSSYAVFCLKKKTQSQKRHTSSTNTYVDEVTSYTK